MAFALEPQEQRVASELEQAGAVLIGDLQDRREAAADRIGDLFRAFAALAGELLGQLREARDVGEQCGAFARPSAAIGIVDQVLLENPRQIGNCAFGVGLGH